jgi:hypothetical protein
MFLKKGISLSKLQTCMAPALITCQEMFDRTTIDLVITSGNDGNHMEGSKHYEGLAFDIRSRELSAIQKTTFIEFLRNRHDNCYDIILESDHIHIEYDENK